MKIRNGFTLIELLAVIIVLGIIATISVPQFGNIINSSKSKTTESDIKMLLHNLQNEIYAKKLNKNFNPSACEVTDSVVTCNGNILDMEKSKNKINGIIYLEDGNIKNYDFIIDNEIYTDIEYTDERCFKWGEFDEFVGIYNYYTYVNNDSQNELCPKEIALPHSYNGKKLTVIGSKAFYGQNLTGIIIPFGVKTIGNEAFGGNQLKSVVIPYSVTEIEVGAFSGNQLKNVVIPHSVTEIAAGTFSGNQLESIVIPNNVTKIDDSAFYKNKLKSVEIPAGVTSIGRRAFQGNFLESIVIPDSVTTIDESAFSYNKLKSVEIGTEYSLITNIGKYSFGNKADNTYGYGPNEITNIRIHKQNDGTLNLTPSGLIDYGVTVEWNE